MALNQYNTNQEQQKKTLKDKAKQVVKDKAKKEVKDRVKDKGKDIGKRVAKKVLKKPHQYLLGKSKLYGKISGKIVGKLAKSVARKKMSAVLAGKVAGFFATPPGWIVGGLLFFFVACNVVDFHSDNKIETDSQPAMGSNVATSTTVQMNPKDQLLYFQNMCAVDIQDEDVSSDESGADWTKRGTTANKNARKLFDHWVDKGLSGAAAAGIIGWVQSEGGFAMIGRAEGYYQSDDPKEASIMYGHEPIPSNASYDVGGGGVYQITPYTKYAPLNSPDWENADKMNAFVMKQIAGGSWDPNQDMTGQNHTFEQFAKLEDPEVATLAFNAYERADPASVKQGQKKEDARKAYEIFNGKKYKFDQKKFDKAMGNASDDSVVVEPAEPVYDPCAVISNGVGWRGAGGQPSITSGTWTYKGGRKGLPKEMKEYALDPESIGMEYKEPNTWHVIAFNGGQCTDLSASLMNALWILPDGSHPVQKLGNGKDVVANWVAAFGGESSTIPTAGAVFSSDGSDPQYGHTGVVSHVFDNGDFLIIEQNVAGYSGDSNNEPYTWNYRYVSQGEINSQNYSFYDPSRVGMNLVTGIEAVG